MNRTLITLLLFSLISGGTAFAQQKVETITVTKSECLDYQQEASHFITETYYGMLQEAVASTEAHSEFIALLMLEDEVKYMPEFVSDHSAQRRMTPTQYFGCLNRTFSDYNSDDLIFKVENLQVYDDFYRHGLRGCYVRAEYNLIIKYRDDILSKKRCRMYCLFPNSGTKKIIKVMQLEPVKDLYVRSEVQKKDISVKSDSFETLLKRAKQGDSDAQFEVGSKYYTGDGVGKNYTEAVKWYRKAAEQGYGIAQNELGACYYNGNGVKQNYAEAVKWFRKAAEQGNASAQSNLGYCYQTGLGVPQNFQKAVKWYRKAAEQGDAGGQYNLGAFFFFAQGVLQDYNEAVKWLRKSAEMGYADAQILLGNCYEKGLGIPQDYREAVKWYRKSAEQGNSVGQLKLADCYYYGRGFTQDYQEAIKLYRMAAEHGHSYAQYRLGYAHYKGIGIPRDFKEAKKWLSLAADQGHDTAKSLLDELNSQTSLDIKRKNDAQSNDTHEWIKVSFDTPLLFREGSALLQKPIEVNAQLQRLNTEVISKLQSHVRIVGHISQKEAEAGKHSLALQRAKNIESILKKHGNVRHCEVKAADESDSFDSAEVLIYMYVSKEALKKAQ